MGKKGELAMVTGFGVKSRSIKLSTKGHTDVIDITDKVASAITDSGLSDGIVTLFAIGSTAALTTIEYEPGLVHDIKEAFERVAPRGGQYKHHDTWHDDNGHSHVRASLLGPSLTVPFAGRKMPLGTWQQIIFVDFDTRGRDREIVVQMLGV